MITLPAYYVPTKYTGYFFNLQDKCLYSLKVAKELRILKKQFPGRFNRINMPGYYVSIKGRQRFLSVAYLRSLSIFDTLKKF